MNVSPTSLALKDREVILRNEPELIKKMYTKLAQAANNEVVKISNFIRIKT